MPFHERNKMAATRTRTATPPGKPAAKAKPEPKPEDERTPGSLAGNLTREPEMRFTQSGRAVANLGVAVNDRVQNPDTGEWEDTEPEFYNVTVWGEQGENAVECFKRGDRIVAVGFFHDRTWQNQEGEEVTRTEFTARDIGPSLLFKNAVIKRVERRK
jgi:single-strand DNA-binding protein